MHGVPAGSLLSATPLALRDPKKSVGVDRAHHFRKGAAISWLHAPMSSGARISVEELHSSCSGPKRGRSRPKSISELCESTGSSTPKPQFPVTHFLCGHQNRVVLALALAFIRLHSARWRPAAAGDASVAEASQHTMHSHRGGPHASGGQLPCRLPQQQHPAMAMTQENHNIIQTWQQGSGRLQGSPNCGASILHVIMYEPRG